MAAPHPPIIVLRRGDDGVSAFLSINEAVQHLSTEHSDDHRLGENLAKGDFFDARGRRLAPVFGSDGHLQDLRVESDASHAEDVRARVRRRSAHVREVLERELVIVEDRSPLALADEDINFEVFARRLANVLRARAVPDVTDDSRGWWHNTFSH